MKPFVFKLQTALEVKLTEEDIFKEQLSDATEVYKHNLGILLGLRKRLREIQGILRGNQSSELDIREIKNCQDFIPVLNDRIKAQETVTENSRQEMEGIRRQLVEIMKERKVLEKLRFRHYQEYVRESLREEQKQIDEMATVGHIRKNPAV